MTSSPQNSAYPRGSVPTIIAEVGVNHNGNLCDAMELVRVAKSAGADVVKFQMFTATEVAHPKARRSSYQKDPDDTDFSQVGLLRQLELGEEDFRKLSDYCCDVGIEFLATGFSEKAVDFLLGLGQRRIKVPSGEVTNVPLLRHIAERGTELILSTGMSELSEIDGALTILENAGTPRNKVTVLQCTSTYPAPLEEANILAMVAMREDLGVSVGYSDHTVGEIAGGVAAALGATVIEKHITLDKNMPGPDHKASADPEEFGRYVEHIHAAVSALGSTKKFVTQSELENRALVRRSIFAAKRIQKGDLFSEENLVCLRPDSGISAMKWDKVIGKVAPRAFGPGDEISL